MNEIPSVKEFIKNTGEGRIPILENIDKLVSLTNEWAKEHNYQIEHIIFIPQPFNSGMYKVFYI